MPGWVEGTYGPTGIMIGCARGVIRTVYCKPDYLINAMPVDVTMNSIIILGAERINTTNVDSKALFCNISNKNMNQVTWGENLKICHERFLESPLCFALWYPDGSIKSNYYYHMICVALFHYLPAYLIDFLLIVLRRKPL